MSDKLLKTINRVILLSILLFSKTIFATQTLTIWSSHQNRDFMTIMANKFKKNMMLIYLLFSLTPQR